MSGAQPGRESLIARAIHHENVQERQFRLDAERFAEYGIGIFYHHRVQAVARRVEEALASWGFAVGCFDESPGLEAATIDGCYLAYDPASRAGDSDIAHAVLRVLEPFGLARATVLNEGDFEAGPGPGTRFRTAPNYLCLVLGG